MESSACGEAFHARSLATLALLLLLLLLLVASTALAAAAAADPPKGVKNGRIVVDTKEGLISIKPDGSGRRPIPKRRGVIFSPDGRSMVFSIWDASSNESDLFIARADGSHRRRLTRGPANDYASDFSPSGKRVLFTRTADRSGYADIHSVAVTGGRRKQLTDTPIDERGGRYSPSGKQVVFSRSDFTNPSSYQRGDIYIARSDGSGERQLTSHPAMELGPRFSPDGRIAFISSRNLGPIIMGTALASSTNIWVMNRDGGGPRVLVGELEDPQAPPPRPPRVTEDSFEFSPDGKWIAFTAEIDTSNAPEPPREELRVARSDGSDVRTILVQSEPDMHVSDWTARPRPKPRRAKRAKGR